MDGAEPTLLEGTTPATVDLTAEHPSDAALIKIMRAPDITDGQKARIIRMLIADQQRYAEQRASELIQQAREGDG